MNAPLHIAPVGVVVIILLILALARHPAEATAVPCSQTGTLAPLNLTNGDSILIIEGLGVTVFPVDKGVPQYSSFINLIFEGVQEFWVNDLYQSDGGCYEPDYPFPYMDPDILPRITALHGLFTKDMMCEQYKVTDTIPLTNIVTEVIVTHMTHPVYPNASMTVNVTKTIGNFTKQYLPSNWTNDIPYRMRYWPDAFKVTLRVDNYPWEGPWDSHLSVITTTAGSMSVESTLEFYEGADAFHLNYTSIGEDPYISFQMALDRGFVFIEPDGSEMPVMNSLNHAGVPLFPLPAGFEWANNVSLAFCYYRPPGQHYNTVIWDPQLSALFGSPDSSQPQSPLAFTPSGLRNNNAAFTIAITVPIFAVMAIIVIGIVIAYFASAKVRAVFTPYKGSHGTA